MKAAVVLSLLALTAPAFAQLGKPSITTGQYNTNRTSANTGETVLNASNVNVTQFGKLFSWGTDGWVFAQPLYVPNVKLAGKTTDVVYVATMHNSVYAFDANNPTGGALWHVSMGPSVVGPTASGCPSKNTGPELGILSTPVIDTKAGTMYLVAAVPSGTGYVHYLHALDMTTGKDRPKSPVLITASVPGTGYDAQNGMISLNAPSTNIQRPSLLLSHNVVYAAFGNCGPDVDPWHGWVLGYNTQSLTQTVVFNTTPNGGQGGIWQSGSGLVLDPSGDLYFNTGNSTVYSSKDSGVTTGSSSGDAAKEDLPMRFVKLSPSGQFLSSFPPANYTALNTNDLDFSSAGPVLIPLTNYLVTGGKDGVIYVFNSANLGTPRQSFQATGTGTCKYAFNGCDHIDSLAFWNSTLYVWGTYDNLRAYKFNYLTGTFSTTPVSKGTVVNSNLPASFAVSGNFLEPSTGIVWGITSDGIVHAFSASNVATELWNSGQNAARDALPSPARLNTPTVANGRVYVPTHSDVLAVYGLLSQTASTPKLAAAVPHATDGGTPVAIKASAPQLSCCTYTPDESSYAVGFSAWGSETGIRSIKAVEIVNAKASVEAFRPGTNEPVEFSATESGWSSYVKFEVTDNAGHVSYVDTCLVDSSQRPEKVEGMEVKDIGAEENEVTIVNQSPGVESLRITAAAGENPRETEITGLRPGETRTVSIASLLPATGEVTVTLTPTSKMEGRAVVVFAPAAITPR